MGTCISQTKGNKTNPYRPIRGNKIWEPYPKIQFQKNVPKRGRRGAHNDKIKFQISSQKDTIQTIKRIPGKPKMTSKGLQQSPQRGYEGNPLRHLKIPIQAPGKPLKPHYKVANTGAKYLQKSVAERRRKRGRPSPSKQQNRLPQAAKGASLLPKYGSLTNGYSPAQAPTEGTKTGSKIQREPNRAASKICKNIAKA